MAEDFISSLKKQVASTTYEEKLAIIQNSINKINALEGKKPTKAVTVKQKAVSKPSKLKKLVRHPSKAEQLTLALALAQKAVDANHHLLLALRNLELIDEDQQLYESAFSANDEIGFVWLELTEELEKESEVKA
jgi:hypothetical protein